MQETISIQNGSIRVLEFGDNNLAKELYGENNDNLKEIESHYGIKIHSGEESSISKGILRVSSRLRSFYRKFTAFSRRVIRLIPLISSLRQGSLMRGRYVLRMCSWTLSAFQPEKGL
jgi:phosphate starvation-inducible protein PhoH